VIDERLRAAKDRIVAPIVDRIPPSVAPGVLTAAAAITGVAAGVGAAVGWRWWSVGAWAASRLLDGVDGALARARRSQTDRGGYLDLLGDTLGYAAVPLGLAVHLDELGVWAACAVLLASFYLNTMSWTLLAAIIEKRGNADAVGERRTTVAMPAGLVEGAETILFYAAMLLFPAYAPVLFVAMAALVAVTVAQRIVWAVRHL
jgi:phosphatidylglycerophosphate synthase